MTEPIIRVEAISKRYGRTLALDAVSLAVAPGTLFALLGPNGAGKTTLVHILCTILRPDSGRAFVNGHDVVRDPLSVRERLGVVFQEPSLDDRLTVRENLDFHGMTHGVPARARRQRIGEVLELVELTEWSGRLARQLSSGMKRRLEIARTLIHNASVLFLDEPTVGLDAQSRERIWSYLTRLRRERGLTVVVTTHYIEEVESCDRVCIIDHGKVLAEGTPAALKAAHGQPLLRVWPRGEAAQQAIAAAYPDARPSGAALLLPQADDAMVDGFLARFGNGVRQMERIEPTLETVFLGLTGRELRDQPAAAREQTLAFGKRGGELTR